MSLEEMLGRLEAAGFEVDLSYRRYRPFEKRWCCEAERYRDGALHEEYADNPLAAARLVLAEVGS